jgi:hypothetical protein
MELSGAFSAMQIDADAAMQLDSDAGSAQEPFHAKVAASWWPRACFTTDGEGKRLLVFPYAEATVPLQEFEIETLEDAESALREIVGRASKLDEFEQPFAVELSMPKRFATKLRDLAAAFTGHCVGFLHFRVGDRVVLHCMFSAEMYHWLASFLLPYWYYLQQWDLVRTTSSPIDGNTEIVSVC